MGANKKWKCKIENILCCSVVKNSKAYEVLLKLLTGEILFYKCLYCKRRMINIGGQCFLSQEARKIVKPNKSRRKKTIKIF